MNTTPADGVVVPFRFIRTKQIVVEGRIYGRRQPLLIDTGSSHTVIHTKTAEAVGIELGKTGGTGGGVGGVDIAMYQLPTMTVELGGHQFVVDHPTAMDLSHVLIALKQSRARQVSVVLGADLLREYGAIINYQNCTITLFPH